MCTFLPTYSQSNPVLFVGLWPHVFSLSYHDCAANDVFLVSIDFTPQQVYCLLCHRYPTGTQIIAPVYTEPVSKLDTSSVYTSLISSRIVTYFCSTTEGKKPTRMLCLDRTEGGQTRFWYSASGRPTTVSMMTLSSSSLFGGGHWGVPFYH